jgi:predicted lipoprotein with Yx(FWY)xxD motif
MRRSTIIAACAAVATVALPGAAEAAGGTVSTIGTHKTPDGVVITGASNRTLYFFRPDERSTKHHAKKSTCYGACAIDWPPVLAKHKPRATGQAKAKLIGLTTRKDGSKQVTYDGLPLYYYVADTKAGQVVGDHLTDSFGFWGALQPDGRLSKKG